MIVCVCVRVCVHVSSIDNNVCDDCLCVCVYVSNIVDQCMTLVVCSLCLFGVDNNIDAHNNAGHVSFLWVLTGMR